MTNIVRKCLHYFNVRLIYLSYFWTGVDPRGGDLPPKTYDSNFVRHHVVQFGKQHSRYRVILSSIVLPHQCCEIYFICLTVAKLL